MPCTPCERGGSAVFFNLISFFSIEVAAVYELARCFPSKRSSTVLSPSLKRLRNPCFSCSCHLKEPSALLSSDAAVVVLREEDSPEAASDLDCTLV